MKEAPQGKRMPHRDLAAGLGMLGRECPNLFDYPSIKPYAYI